MPHTTPHAEELRDELQSAGEHAKRMIDHIVRAACLLLEDRASDQAVAVEIEKTPAQSDDVELLTTKELARRISYSTRQIQTFKLEGMPYTGEKRNTRFELNKVIEWLEQRSQTHHKNNRVSMVGNGRIAKAPSARLQAAKRI